MLRILRTGQRWLTAILVAGIGTVFVVFLGLQGPSDFTSSQHVVKVGPLEFGIAEFERLRERHEQMFQAQQGEKYNARAMREMLDQLAANDLVQTGLLALAAEDLGIQVTTREIERQVLADPGLRDEQGKFDRELFNNYIQQVYGSQKAFMAERRLVLLSAKMLQLLQGLPEVSDGEAREAARRDLEEVQIAFVSLDAGPGEPPEIAPDAVAAAVAGRAEEIAKVYEAQGEIYNRPERVHVRHIFKRLSKDAPAADVDRVRGEMEAAAKRVEGGEPFETVAGEVSEDPGAKTTGGDLEPFARGGVPKPLEDAAFALSPGQVSAPVRTDYGFHLVKLEERLDALTRPLEAVREEIATEILRHEALRDRARARADQVAEAVRGGKSLEDAARDLGIAVRHSGWLSRRNGYVPGLGNSPDALAAAFVLAPGTSSPRVFETGEEFALLRVLERKEGTPEQIDALLATKRDELLSAKRQARINTWMETRRAELEASGELLVDLKAING